VFHDEQTELFFFELSKINGMADCEDVHKHKHQRKYLDGHRHFHHFCSFARSAITTCLGGVCFFGACLFRPGELAREFDAPAEVRQRRQLQGGERRRGGGTSALEPQAIFRCIQTQELDGHTTRHVPLDFFGFSG
jgi:hypothetical protein